jgi:high-affinity Fe2+/Pb2+ permease
MAKWFSATATALLIAALVQEVNRDTRLVWFIVPILFVIAGFITLAQRRWMSIRSQREQEARVPIEARWLLVYIADSKQKSVILSQTMGGETIIVDKGIFGYASHIPEQGALTRKMIHAIAALEDVGALRLTNFTSHSSGWRLTAIGDALAERYRPAIPAGYEPSM